MSLQPNHVYQFGPYRLDSTERRLLRDGETVAHQPKVFDLLLALVERHGHLLEKDELMRTVWPDAEVEEANLSNNVSILRKTLGEAGEAERYIETVPKHGYRFVAEVMEVAGEAAVTPAAATPVSPTSPETEAADTAARSGGNQSAARRRWNLRLGAALGVTLALAAAVGFWPKGHTAQPPETLAVLPFADASADAQAGYLSDGLAESLINRLSQLPGLRVTARDSSFHFKDQSLSAQQVGQRLGVRAVLTGRVAERDGRLAVRVDLLRVADVTPLWGAEYNRPTAEVFALQEEIARGIAAALRLEEAAAERVPRRHPVNFAAYQFYLKGRYHYGTLMPEGVRLSVEYFHRAIQIDPDYALAYAGLADAYGGLSYHGEIPPREALTRREALASKALALDDTLAEAHLAMASVKVSDWNWAGAESEFRRAIELRPHYTAAHAYYSDYLSAVGRFDEAAAEINLALQSDPVSPVAIIATVIPFRARRYDEAIARCRQLLEIEPEYPGLYSLLGEAYEQQGRYAEAIAAFEQARARLGGVNMLDMLAHVHAVAGHRAAALKLLAELQRVAAREYVSPYDLARVYVGLGETDRAFEYLEKAYAERNGHSAT